MYKISKSFFLYVLTASLLFISCKSLKPPKTVPAPLNYTDNDIVKIEIDRINKFLETEPVRALWRACLLGNEEIVEKCRKAVELRLEVSLEEREYLDTRKYYKSLMSAFPGWKHEKYSLQQIEEMAARDVPALSGTNKKAPEKIADCMQATVTIWVDRGIKVQAGAGYADIIIGSGFFIDERGYIVTNHHVIESMVDPKYEGYSRLYIKLLNDSVTKIPARVVGYDPVMDLALLKVEIVPDFVFNLGGSRDLETGDKISAIGTPIGLEGTLTSGIISSTDRKLMPLGSVFQIDAAVNSGNSGGPLIDSKLKVQAVVFAGMLQYQGLNFAIPVEYLKQELNFLYKREEVRHSWLGCYGHTKREASKKTGLEVQYVIPGGSAFMSGIRPDDIIIQIDGKDITSIDDFNYFMMGCETETILQCKYLNSEKKECSCLVYLDVRPKSPGLTIFQSDLMTDSFVPLFGMKLVSSSTINRNLYTIEKVISGTVADNMHFSPNDSVTVRDMVIDEKNEYISVLLYTKRKKKAFLDMSIGISAAFDSPYYF